MEYGSQKIKLKIYLKEYELTVHSPEEEKYARRAAVQVNELITQYNSLYPDKDIIDKLLFIALNQSEKKLFLENELENRNLEDQILDSKLSEYLKEK